MVISMKPDTISAWAALQIPAYCLKLVMVTKRCCAIGGRSAYATLTLHPGSIAVFPFVTSTAMVCT
jgi:hypothetical protein